MHTHSHTPMPAPARTLTRTQSSDTFAYLNFNDRHFILQSYFLTTFSHSHIHISKTHTPSRTPTHTHTHTHALRQGIMDFFSPSYSARHLVLEVRSNVFQSSLFLQSCSKMKKSRLLLLIFSLSAVVLSSEAKKTKKSKTQLKLFSGEYYDGTENHFYKTFFKIEFCTCLTCFAPSSTAGNSLSFNSLLVEMHLLEEPDSGRIL